MSKHSSDSSNDTWKSIEQFFSQPLPFFQDGDQNKWMKDMAWVEDLVKQSIEQSVSKAKPASTSAHLKPKMFQTHRNVIVRIPVPPAVNPRALQVYLHAYQLKIIGLQGQDEKIIKLPVPVLSMRCKASFKDGILQIRARKQQQKQKYREIYIEF